jgi:uncharacterized protein
MRICVVATLALLGLQPAFADDAKPTEESIKHLFETMGTSHLIDDMVGQMDKTMRASVREGMHGQTLNAEQQKIFDDMMTKLMSMMKEQIDWSAMEPLMVRVYRDTFTQQEVDAMVRFYSSPAGRSVSRKLPVAMQESMQLMHERMQGLIPRIGQLEKDTAQRMKEAADSPAAPPSPGAPPPAQSPSAH